MFNINHFYMIEIVGFIHMIHNNSLQILPPYVVPFRLLEHNKPILKLCDVWLPATPD